MGRRRPTLEEICTLSVIYGRTFESFFGEVMEEVKANLRTRILTMPKNTRTYAGTLNRDKSIERLARRLAEETAGDAPDYAHGGGCRYRPGRHRVFDRSRAQGLGRLRPGR
jgi:hypothetical protein